MKKVILFLIIICLLVFVFAGYKITNELRAQKEEINDFNELAELVAKSTNTQEQTEPTIEQENNDPSIETETLPETLLRCLREMQIALVGCILKELR